MFFLERVADGEVERLVAFEGMGIEVAWLIGLIRHMEAKAPVEAQHEESHVVAQANACAEGQVVKEVLKAEVAVLIDVLEKLHSIIRNKNLFLSHV